MILRCTVLGLLLGCAVRVLSEPATEATLQDMSEELTRIKNSMNSSLNMIHTDMADQLGLLVELERDDLVPIRNDAHALRMSIENAFGNSEGSVNSGPWFKEFLLGSPNDPFYTQYPQFRTLKHFARGASSPSVYPENSVGDQSLTFFLSTTLGGMFDSANGPVAYQNDWNNYFTTNSTFFRIRSASGNIGPGGSMYASFPIWLAEAQRRLISNTSNTTARVGELLETPQDWSSASSNAVVATPTENDFELERPDGVEWFGEDLIEGPEWTLSGAAINPVVYSDTSRGYTLRLSFEGWGPICRALCSFLVYVGTAVCMVGIIKTEVDYWTTLGGAAT